MIVVLCVTALTEPLYHGQLAKDYLQRTVNPTLIKGLTQLCKQKPEDPLVNLAAVVKMDNRPYVLLIIVRSPYAGMAGGLADKEQSK